MRKETFHEKINKSVREALKKGFKEPFDEEIIMATELGYHAGYGDCFKDVYPKLVEVSPSEDDVIDIIKTITDKNKVTSGGKIEMGTRSKSD